MNSQAQIDANRENSRLSTGPSSPEGKAASAQNARTHGFSSQASSPNNVVPPGREQDFLTFRDALRSQLQPSGPIEEFLFRRIVHSSWNVELIDEAEAAVFFDPADMYLDDANEKKVARFARYRTMHMRLYNQAMRSLQYEQTQRGLRSVAPESLPAQLPPQANLPKVSDFAKRSQIRERFSTFPPEWQDALSQMEIETNHINAQLRQSKEEKRVEATAA